MSEIPKRGWEFDPNDPTLNKVAFTGSVAFGVAVVAFLVTNEMDAEASTAVFNTSADTLGNGTDNAAEAVQEQTPQETTPTVEEPTDTPTEEAITETPRPDNGSKMNVEREGVSEAESQNESTTDATCEEFEVVGEPAIVDDSCDGAISMLMELGFNLREATNLAIEMGMYIPGEDVVKESAVLLDGDVFERGPNDSVRVLRENSSGERTLLASSGCGEDIAWNPDNMLDSRPCVEEVEPTPEPVVVPPPAPEIVPEPEPEVVPPPAPEVIPEPEPEVVPDPTPEVVDVPDYSVRTLLTPSYQCVDNCGVVEPALQMTPFLVFDSVSDAEHFFSSEAGQNTLRALNDESGAKLGKCVLITDGAGNLQGLDLRHETITHGRGLIEHRLILDENGTPQLGDSRELYDMQFEEMSRNGGVNTYTLNEEDFETRYSRGLGDASDAHRSSLPDVGNSETVGVGHMPELNYNPETGQWGVDLSPESVRRTVEAIVDASGIDVEQYNAIKENMLPDEFYSQPENIRAQTRALHDLIESRGVDINWQGAENLTRIINEHGFGRDGGIQYTSEQMVTGLHGTGQSIVEPLTGQVTLDQAVLRSADNRELITHYYITGRTS
ncbi:MAG: hypothetical protein ACJKTH_00990 [Patescibacteria group bacterium UBA2163]